MKIKRTLGLILLTTAIVGLPIATLLNQSVGKVFSRPFTSRVLHEQVFATPKLAFSLKALVNERIKEVTDLKTGMIVAIFSKADSRKWQELLDRLLPGRLRNPVIDEVISGAYQWLEGEGAYPNLVVQTGPVIRHMEAHTEFLFRWAHSVTNAPMPAAREVLDLKNRNYGDSIPPLLMGNVPDSLYNDFARRGGELMAIRLYNASPPATLDLTQLIKEKVSETDMLKAKAAMHNMKFISSWLWLMLLIILAVGIWLYGSKAGSFWPLAVNTLGSMALAMFALGWMASNYLLSNWELTINARTTGVPRAIRDQLIALITYYLNHASASMYLIGFILLGTALVLYAARFFNLKPYYALQFKNKKL